MKDVARSLLRSVAPTLGTAIGGPFGGMAARAVSEKLLGKPDASESELERALLGASPEQLAEIKKIEADFKAQMKQLDVDLERIAADDRASARKREESVGGFAVPAIAAVVIVGFFAAVFASLLGFAQVESAMAGTLVGFVAAKAEQVVSYYFGSSAGSAKKNEMLRGRN